MATHCYAGVYGADYVSMDGCAAPDLSETLALKLLGIVQLGMGSYIASRGVEKVMKNILR